MTIIKNRVELELSTHRKMALDLIEHGIKSVLPGTIMTQAIRFEAPSRLLTIAAKTFDLNQSRLFVIGGGKASGLMAETFENIVGPKNICAGVINDKSGGYRTQKIQINEAGHPVPDERGIAGVHAMLDMRGRHAINEKDVVVCLISGGGSALMPCPAPGISLAEKQQATRLLLSCGADIHEINTIRKHLSASKGGGLGAHFAPATVISLILSDVVGDNLDVIASGPTVPDSSTFRDAWHILEKYKLLDRIAPAVVSRLQRGMDGYIPENPSVLPHCSHYLIGNNRIALSAMQKKAEAMGMRSLIVTSQQTGDPAQAAAQWVTEIKSGRYRDYRIVLGGGETTPVLPANPGRGGRNQHFAASILHGLRELEGDWVCVSIGTDGSDYLPDVAGAVVDRKTLRSAADILDLEASLTNYDTNSFFKRAGGSLIQTGSTGTNVCDLILFMSG